VTPARYDTMYKFFLPSVVNIPKFITITTTIYNIIITQPKVT